VEVYDRNRYKNQTWVEASRSNHIWQGCGQASRAGTQRVAVWVTDQYGPTFATSIVLEVMI
jgi:hypothetical protein